MNINELRTPEGLNRYLNHEINTLSQSLPDYMLKLLLWQKIKFDFLSSDDVVMKLYEEDQNHLLVIKSDESNTNMLIGFLHISDDLHLNLLDLSKDLSNKAKIIVKNLNNLIIKNNWTNNQIFIISTYKISHFQNIKLNQFPSKVKYLFLTESPDDKKKFYEIALDNITNEYFE
jgi:hypothetical protein